MEESIEKNETLDIDNLPDLVPKEEIVDIEEPVHEPESIEETPESVEEPEASEEPQNEFKDWDKDKSVKAYQKLQSEKDKEREARIRLEERLKILEEQGTQKPSQPLPPKLKMPIEPTMPEGYNEIEAVAEPDGLFGQAKRAYDKYLKDMIKYQAQELNHIKEETTLSKKEREMLDLERQAQGEFIKLGCSAEKAAKVLRFASQPNTVTYERMLKLYDMEFPETPNTEAKTKIASITKQGERHGEVLPPGVKSTETVEKPKSDNPLDDVVEYARNARTNREL